MEHKFENNLELKYCGACTSWKELSEFVKNKNTRDGFADHCKVCRHNEYKKYYDKNRVKLTKNSRQWKRKNQERVQQHNKNWYKKHPEKTTEYSRKRTKEQPEKVKEVRLRYQEKNVDKIKIRSKVWTKKNHEKIVRYRKKRKQCITNRLSDNFSTAIWLSLKGNKNGRHCFDLVPYTLEEYKNHLESLFEPGMTWNNYGNRPGCWTVDHIKPVAAFNFTSYEDPEFKECWALSNLRPLGYVENMKKNSKYKGILIRKRVTDKASGLISQQTQRVLPQDEEGEENE